METAGRGLYYFPNTPLLQYSKTPLTVCNEYVF